MKNKIERKIILGVRNSALCSISFFELLVIGCFYIDNPIGKIITVCAGLAIGIVGYVFVFKNTALIISIFREIKPEEAKAISHIFVFKNTALIKSIFRELKPKEIEEMSSSIIFKKTKLEAFNAIILFISIAAMLTQIKYFMPGATIIALCILFSMIYTKKLLTANN